MPDPAAFPAVFQKLRAILARHAPPLVVSADGDAGYTVDLARADIPASRRFVGGVRSGKSYVSFHLMPIYLRPALLDGISPELRKRMQGKSCFNFAAVDDQLFDELAGLTGRAIDYYRRDGAALLASLSPPSKRR